MRVSFVIVLLFIFGEKVKAQPFLPQEMPCYILNQPELINVFPDGGGMYSIDCIETAGDLDFDPTKDYSLRAGERISFYQNTHILPDDDHQFHAYLDQPNFDVAWYEPFDVGTVPQYEKLELGVQFEDFINDEIINYVDHNPFANAPDGSLNPFNPEEVDVYAEIWVEINEEWIGPQKVNAFYYEEFERGATDWGDIENEHSFRIRYTPRVVGLYKCRVVSKVEGYSETQSEFFNFVCEPSNSKGFMRIGDNKRYFKIGDEPFFPVGQNLTGPNNTSLTWEWSQQTCQPQHYLGFQNLMTQLSESGGNYFRYIVSPWQTEIEFEHLGNYSNRLSNAWEFDRILDTAKALDLRIHWNMQMHYAFEAPNGFAMTQWDWSSREDAETPSFCYSQTDSGYCYRKELDIESPVDFLTNETAKKHYKNRIRYMISRWGYSPQIAVIELLSEAQSIGYEAVLEYNYTYGLDSLTGDSVIIAGGCDDLPFADNVYSPKKHDSINFYSKLVPWQIEMLSFIKTDLAHLNQPTAVSSAGEPDFDNGDLIFQSNAVDIATWNRYQFTIERNSRNYLQLNNPELSNSSYHVETFQFPTFPNPRYIDKPIMHSEYGFSGGVEECDNNIDFIKTVYLTPFIGLAASAMSWNKHLNEEGVWEYIGIMRDFMEGIKLDEENWQPGEPIIQDDKSVEVYYLVSEQGSTNAPRKAVGVICNRTYNYYTQGDTLPCTSDSLLSDLSAYGTAENFDYSDLDKIKIPNMGTFKDYNINWINALTGDPIVGTLENTGLSGKLELNYPQTLTGDESQPMIFFQVYSQGSTFKSQQNNAGIVGADQKEAEHLEPLIVDSEKPASLVVKVAPNPTNSFVNIMITGLSDEQLNWTLSDLNGRKVKSGKINKPNAKIDLSVFESGMYYLHLKGETDLWIFKIIKQ